jgi:hypothetical protein
MIAKSCRSVAELVLQILYRMGVVRVLGSLILVPLCIREPWLHNDAVLGHPRAGVELSSLECGPEPNLTSFRVPIFLINRINRSLASPMFQ